MSNSPEPVAALYRCPSDKQEDSIDRQKMCVVAYVRQKGHEIISEYVFEGIPGDEIYRHPRFLEFLRDAVAGKWKRFVTDTSARLSRDDAVEFIARVVDPLRDAGAKWDTVMDGPQDWNSLAGIITATIKSQQNYDFLVEMSKQILSGQVKAFLEKRLWNFIEPYGLRKVYEFDPQKNKRVCVGCVFGPQEEVDAVIFIFEHVALGWTLRHVCRELEARGVKPPKGNGRGKYKAEGRWNRSTISDMVRNRKYVGDLEWNKKHVGKYNRWTGGVGGNVEKHETKNERWLLNKPEDVFILPDIIPPIIKDRDLFMRANAVLKENQKRTAPGRDENGYLFTHMLVCGDCGSYLHGRPLRGGKGYVCGKHKEYGKDACHRNAVLEKVLLRFILDPLLNVILDPARLDAIEADMKRQLEAERSGDGSKRLDKEIAKLRKNIEKGNENLALLPPD